MHSTDESRLERRGSEGGKKEREDARGGRALYATGAWCRTKFRRGRSTWSTAFVDVQEDVHFPKVGISLTSVAATVCPPCVPSLHAVRSRSECPRLTNHLGGLLWRLFLVGPTFLLMGPLWVSASILLSLLLSCCTFGHRLAYLSGPLFRARSCPSRAPFTGELNRSSPSRNAPS